MALTIADVTTKNVIKPSKTVIHGVAGVGKTTYAVQACKENNGIFLCCEDGLNLIADKENVEIPRINLTETAEDNKPFKWEDFQSVLRSLIKDDHDFKCLVIDTLDATIPSLDEYVVRTFYDGDYKKADAFKQKFADYKRELNKVLSALDILVNKRNMEIIILVHSTITNHKDPLQEDYHRYDINLPGGPKTSLSETIVDWAENVFFANYAIVTKKKDPKSKFSTTIGEYKGRVAHTEYSAGYVAKSRYSLPKTFEFNYNTYKNLIKKGGK